MQKCLEWYILIPVMADEETRIEDLALRPLTRVKYTAAAVERAERALHRARLAHADAIIAAQAGGYSLAQIGQALGITRGRVHQLIRWREDQRKGKS
jgi:DNA-directed RNA polymerase specialized sigma24 family protein